MIEIVRHKSGLPFWFWRVRGGGWNGCFDTSSEALAHAWAVCGSRPALVYV